MWYWCGVSGPLLWFDSEKIKTVLNMDTRRGQGLKVRLFKGQVIGVLFGTRVALVVRCCSFTLK